MLSAVKYSLYPKKYDAFISYAVEDREIACALHDRLSEKGLNIFFLSTELDVGDPISQKIYTGLKRSRCCIAILSVDYCRFWTHNESGIFHWEEFTRKEHLILPVWHAVTYDQVKLRFHWLQDKYGISTDKGYEIISQKLYDVIRVKRKREWFFYILKSFSFLAMLALIFLVFTRMKQPQVYSPRISGNEINEAIEKRISNAEEQWIQSLHEASEVQTITLDSIIKIFDRFSTMSPKNYERNEYRFTNGYTCLTGKRNIEDAGLPLFISPYTGFGIKKLIARVHYDTAKGGAFNCCYIISNQDSAFPEIDTVVYLSPTEAMVRVSYRNPVRHVKESLAFTSSIERRQQIIMALKPVEEYLFEIRKGKWEFTTLN
jgi:hypothetical protein